MRRALVLLLCVAAAGCRSDRAVLRVATTTSVENSGLLAAILPAFERQSHLTVEVLAVGSGQALNLIGRGEVAVGLTHDPGRESDALASGIITNYRKIMFNDFIIVGPADDPAAVAGASGAAEAFLRIAGGTAPFVSRGDASGTYSREQELWELAGRRPTSERLLDTGQGMGATLRVASERGGYTLSDRATFEQFRAGLRLAPLHQGGAELLNTYAVFLRAGAAEAERHAATAFTDWLADGEGRDLIANFVPNGGNGQAVFRAWPKGAERSTPADLPPLELANVR